MKQLFLLLAFLLGNCLLFAQQETLESIARKPSNKEITKPLVDLRTKELIQKAIDRIPENYPDRPHQMEGFYRKVSTYENEYTHLLEAAFLMEDSSYTTYSHSALNVKLLQQRQSTEWGKIDEKVVIAVRNSAQRLAKHVKHQVASSNTIHRTYEYNSLRGYNSPHTIFNSLGRFTEGINFRIRDTSLVENDTIFHVLISDALMPEGTSYLKINRSDLAIVEYQRAIYLFGYDFTEQVHVRYKKIDGRYYPDYIQVKVPRIINEDIGGHQLDIHTLWVNRVDTGKFKKMKEKEKIDRMQELQVLTLPYNEAFWAEYPMLKIHPLEKQIQRSLERNKSLDRQFEEMAAR